MGKTVAEQLAMDRVQILKHGELLNFMQDIRERADVLGYPLPYIEFRTKTETLIFNPEIDEAFLKKVASGARFR